MSKKTNKSKETKKKRKIWKKVLIVIVLILLGASGVFAYKVHINGGGTKGILSTVLDTKKDVGEFRCLVLGISTDEKGSLLTDTIMIASYNPQTQKAALVSVPRDTYTGKNTAKATAYEKINALYSRKEDPQTVLDAVNNLTGLDLQYYVIVKTEAFIKLVDAIGEVTFNVPIDMNYDDTSQDLHIHLKAGEQKLDGDKAEQLVRFRHNNNGTSYPDEYGNNDLGRMRTQREFIMAVIKQTAKVENITKLGQILDVAKENVITNIDFDVAKDYIPYIVEFNTDNLETAALPGTTPDWSKTNNVSIFVLDKVETKMLINQIFELEDEEETSSNTTNTTNSTKNTISNTTNTTSSTTNKSSNIKIEILNGTGSGNNLQKLTEKLKSKGFNVSRTGTTNETNKTVIINKKSVSETIMKDIKQAVGVGTISNVESGKSSKVDITIIIGKDYDNKIGADD
ncbi:MAG: LCP family protein [Clostridia bacterium]